ncbi:MAG TPA: hypothetical protein VNL17_03055 [Verrucomicrobiae bacterium]|nr:hypothetical protein [Verrucomicrobiae bacterium]
MGWFSSLVSVGLMKAVLRGSGKDYWRSKRRFLLDRALVSS